MGAHVPHRVAGAARADLPSQSTHVSPPPGATDCWPARLMMHDNADTERMSYPPSCLDLLWPPCGPATLAQRGLLRSPTIKHHRNRPTSRTPLVGRSDACRTSLCPPSSSSCLLGRRASRAAVTTGHRLRRRWLHSPASRDATDGADSVWHLPAHEVHPASSVGEMLAAVARVRYYTATRLRHCHPSLCAGALLISIEGLHYVVNVFYVFFYAH